MRLILNCIKHFFHKIINVKEFQLSASIIYLYRQIISYIIAESRNSAIVIRSAPLSKQIRETVYIDLCTCLGRIIKEQVLTCQLASAILAVIASDKCSLQ